MKHPPRNRPAGNEHTGSRCSRFHRDDQDATATTVRTSRRFFLWSRFLLRSGDRQPKFLRRNGGHFRRRNGHGLPDRFGLRKQGAGATNGENKHANDVQNRQLGRQPDARGHPEQCNAPDVLQADDQSEARHDGESCPDNGASGADREPGVDYGFAAADAHNVSRSGARPDDGGGGDSGPEGDHYGANSDTDTADQCGEFEYLCAPVGSTVEDFFALVGDDHFPAGWCSDVDAKRTGSGAVTVDPGGEYYVGAEGTRRGADDSGQFGRGEQSECYDYGERGVAGEPTECGFDQWGQQSVAGVRGHVVPGGGAATAATNHVDAGLYQ